MKLLPCPACNNPVSTVAASCPQCGHPIAGKKTEATTGISAVMVLAGMFASGYLAFKYAYKMHNQILGITLIALPTVIAMVLASLRKKS